MNIISTRNLVAIAVCLALCMILAACGADLSLPDANRASNPLIFGPEQRLGDNEKNPSTPFLRYSPDGRLFAIWTEDHDIPWSQGAQSPAHQHRSDDMTASPMRNAMLAWSADGGKTWSPPVRVNSNTEAVQGRKW